MLKRIGNLFMRGKQGSIRKKKVFALVGPTGTGKSFRAKLIAEKRNIDFIIDDGLLIRGQTIVAGRSAKREKNRIRAIKRAIFEEPDHVTEVRAVLESDNYSSVMVIGTSEKMVGRIVERLGLPYPEEIIYIQDVATTAEIARAREIRKTQGKHVIPAPVIEVRKDPSQRVLDSIKFFFKRHPLQFWKQGVVEKTIVQPPYSRRGRLMISEEALSQMIMHCIQEYHPEMRVQKIVIDETCPDCYLDVHVQLPYGTNIAEILHGLHEYIIKNVERFTGIHIEGLDLTVDHVN